DPIGFAFEHYDGSGRFRADDGGKPVDATTTIDVGTDVDGPIESFTDWAERFGDSEDVAGCMTQQWTRFAAQRETHDEACVLAVLQDAIAESGGNLRELLVSIASSDLVRMRAVQNDSDGN